MLTAVTVPMYILRHSILRTHLRVKPAEKRLEAVCSGKECLFLFGQCLVGIIRLLQCLVNFLLCLHIRRLKLLRGRQGVNQPLHPESLCAAFPLTVSSVCALSAAVPVSPLPLPFLRCRFPLLHCR